MFSKSNYNSLNGEDDNDLEVGLSTQKKGWSRKKKAFAIIAGVLGAAGAGFGGYEIYRFTHNSSDNSNNNNNFCPPFLKLPTLNMTDIVDAIQTGEMRTGPTLAENCNLNDPDTTQLELDNRYSRYREISLTINNETIVVGRTLGKDEQTARERMLNFTYVSGFTGTGTLVRGKINFGEYANVRNFAPSNPSFITNRCEEIGFEVINSCDQEAFLNAYFNQDGMLTTIYKKGAEMLNSLLNGIYSSPAAKATPYVTADNTEVTPQIQNPRFADDDQIEQTNSLGLRK